jgi:hypothetical protein
MLRRVVLLGLMLGAVTLLPIAGSAQQPVTVHSFNRAETDRYIAEFAQRSPHGQFYHGRDVTSVTDQPVIRMNRDTLYSSAIVDLDAGPATITLPDSGGRFASILAIDQDHFVYGVFYAPATFVFTREQVGTRYLVLLGRVFANPADAADMAAARRFQDSMVLQQAATGRLELPSWNTRELDAIRAQLNGLMPFADASRALGRRGAVNPLDHVIATAAGWGGNPREAATYLPIVPPGPGNAWRLRLPSVPVDGFWSVTMYNAAGFMAPNPRDAYSVNNVTARAAADGSVTVQMGGCTDTTENCLPTPEGWNALLRLYRPRAEILDGRWRMPALEAVR